MKSGDSVTAAERLERSTLEERVAELEREQRLVQTLFRVGQAIAGERELQEIVQLVTDEATALVGAQFGAFFYNRIDAAGESYMLYTISGVPRSKFERFPMPRNSDVFRPTFEGRGIVRFDDVTADPLFGRNAPYYGLPPGHLPVRSYLAVPVFVEGGEVAGGLFFGHEEAGAFGEEAEHVVSGIATLAGLAISRARLLEAEQDARAAAEERARAAAALDHVGDGVVMVDASGVVRIWNRAAAQITGLPAASVENRPVGEAIAGWEDVVLRVPVGPPGRPGGPRTLPLDLAGRELWLSLYGVEFEEGVVYAFRDVTDERRLDELRSDLIATVSHEIRTPVAAVYGAARTLLRDELDDETRERLFQVLASESERLAALVSEILLASSIESDRLVVSREDVDLARLVRTVVHSSELAGSGARLELDVPAEEIVVVGDGDRIGQVLANMLENAAKYGAREGKAQVAVRVVPRETAVRVEVSDRGRGIPAAEQERIFEKFYRLDPRLEQGIRGTGLGLYISRELVDRMQGTIGVESVEEEGSTFWFELPRPWT